MKKLITLVLALHCMVGLVGCSQKAVRGSEVYSFPEPTTMITGLFYSQGQETAFEIGSEDYDPNDLSVNAVIEWFYDLELTACDEPEVVAGGESYDFYVGSENAFTYVDRGSDAYLIIDNTYYKVNNPSIPPIEQTADTGEYPPCVMVDGVIYKDTGYVASTSCGTMDGEIVSTVPGTELPSKNNQSNFGSGYQYQRSSEGQIIVVIDEEPIVFRDIEKDDSSIPMEVINFNAEVKEITDNGELLVMHVSTAEGFQMNGGEYYVSTENLVDDVQVGDIVTIWFNGTIEETYPAQLDVVYRIVKAE